MSDYRLDYVTQFSPGIPDGFLSEPIWAPDDWYALSVARQLLEEIQRVYPSLAPRGQSTLVSAKLHKWDSGNGWVLFQTLYQNPRGTNRTLPI